MLINEKITVKGKIWNTETFFTDAIVQLNERAKKREIKMQQLTPKSLDALAKDFHSESDEPENLYNVLEKFYAISNKQLPDFFNLQREYASKLPCNLLAPAFPFTATITPGKIDDLTKVLVIEGEKATGIPFQQAAFLGDQKLLTLVNQKQEQFLGGSETKRGGCSTQNYPYLYSTGVAIPRLGSGFSTITNSKYPGTCHFHHREFRYPIKSVVPLSPAAVAMISSHGLGGKIYGQDYSISYRPVWAFLYFGAIPFPLLTAAVTTKKR